MYHSFDVDIAATYGVNAALILNDLYFWCEHSRLNGKNFFDGNYWTYNSRKALAEHFGYLTPKQIATATDKLIRDGLIITGNYNQDSRDRTLWYAITGKGLSILQKGKPHLPKKENENTQNVKPLPDTITDTIADTKKENYIKEKSSRKRFGEYKHVLLSEDEVARLVTDYGQEVTAKYIKKVDEYCEQSGRRYKNYYLAIRNTFMGKDNIKKLSERAKEEGKWGMII